MARIAFVVLSIFLLAESAQALGSYPDIVQFFKDNDAVAEVTILSARLHTYRFKGAERVCGSSYLFNTNEIVFGHVKHVQSVGSQVWGKEERALRSFDVGMRIGSTYLVGIDQRGDYRRERTGFDFLPGERLSSAYARCLEGMPHDVVRPSLEVFRADSSFPNGIPNDGREYLKIISTRSLASSAIFGALSERYYSKEDEIDPKARAYLSDNGIYPPAEAQRAGTVNAYLKDIGRNGDYDFYQVTVSYDAFKRFILDPKYVPLFRLNG